MSIDIEKVRWASVASLSPADGLPNTSARPSEVKDSGIKNNQGLPLQWLNGQFNDIAKALQEAQTQIDAIVGGSAQPTLELIYAVDDIYMSFSSISPATRFGFGTWVALAGKFLVSVDSSDTDFDTAGKTGGSKAHTHTDNFVVDGHTITVGQLPSEIPFTLDVTTTGSAETAAGNANPLTGDDVAQANSDSNVNWEGLGQPHAHGLSGGVQSQSNLPPFTAVYMWRRTA